MWKYNITNLSTESKINWKWKRKKSSSSSLLSDQDQRSADSSWSFLADQNETEKKLQIPQSWRLIEIDADSKSWEALKSREKSEQDIINLFEKINPEDFEINGQFPGSKNTLLHEAAITGKRVLLEKLLQYKPDVNIRNKEGDTPIISLVQECANCKNNICEAHLECLKILTEANANLNTKNNIGLTVLSYATMCSEEKREKYVKKLLRIEKKNFATGLYQALESKLDIQFLEELNRIRRDMSDKKLQEFMYGKYTLLQGVCEYGMPESAKYLLQIGADPIFSPIIPSKPIQLACIFSHPDILQLLIEKDDILLQVKTKSERNLFHSTVKNTTNLDKAYECLKVLLNHKDKININDVDKDGRTPLHYAVLHDRDECAVELLGNGANIDIEDKWKQTPLMRISATAFEKYLDNMIIDDSSDAFQGNKSVESKETAKPEIRNKNTGAKESRTIIFDFTNLFRKVHEENDLRNSRMTRSEINPTTDHTTVSLPEEYYSFPTEMLCKIKDTKRLEKLIQHPVLSLIIYFKWFHVRALFYTYLFLYFLFCILFTLYIWVTEDWPFRIIPAKSKPLQSGKLNIIATIISIAHDTDDKKIYIIIPILIIIAIFLFFESLKFSQKKLKYLFDMDNLLRLAVIIFAILVMICLNSSIFSPFCPHLKAISVLLTWFELFLVIGKYPNLSYYVSTFRSASLNLFKFLSVHVILLIGFALSFHLLFRSSNTDNTFTNPFNALFKTIVMITAEFDANEIPFYEYSLVSYLIFIVFIFVITIVLLNLMIAIAFKEVKQMEKNRHLYESLAQIDYIKHFEDNFSENFIIRTIYSWFSANTCCTFSVDRGSYSVREGDMKLTVSVTENDQEFNHRLVFETYPEQKVKIETISKTNEVDKNSYRNFYRFKIFRTCHELRHSVIENAQEIVSKRFSKNEEAKKENSKTDFEILRNELIELRRFIQACFDKKEQKEKDSDNQSKEDK